MRWDGMGIVYADVVLRGPAGERSNRLLVDTGATHTWIPEDVARALGARERGTIRVRLGDGRVVERPLRELEVEILGRAGTAPVVCGGPQDVSVIGVTTLEILLLEPDPILGGIRPAPYALLLAAA